MSAQFVVNDDVVNVPISGDETLLQENFEFYLSFFSSISTSSQKRFHFLWKFLSICVALGAVT